MSSRDLCVTFIICITCNSREMLNTGCPPTEHTLVHPQDQTVVQPPEPSTDLSRTAEPGSAVRFPAAPFTSSVLETAGPGSRGPEAGEAGSG